MIKHLRLVGCLAVIISAWSCEPAFKVSSDYDKNVDFKQYKTFSLYTAEGINDAISKLNQDRIFAAIRSEMVKKGFQEATSAPDVLVNTIAILKDRVSVSSNTNYYGYGGSYRPYYWGGTGSSGYTTYDVNHYKDGSLIIDVIDAETKKLIWQGVGNKEIDAPIKDPDTKIPKAVASIMSTFPPGSAKKS
jgi:Domain of unknown function (DUF4136)